MPKTLFGDVNMDGRIDITDAVLLNKMAAGVVEANQSQRLNGDVNGNDRFRGRSGTVHVRDPADQHPAVSGRNLIGERLLKVYPMIFSS